MIDLTNRTVEEVQALIQKYGQLLEVSDIKNHNDIPILAIIIDIGINHINDNYKDIPKDWKAWSMVVVKGMFYEGKVNNIKDIKTIIDEFIFFWKSDYEKYCDDTIAVNEYERDRGFAYKYIWNKKR
ncbi:MAG: hypothetical protein JW866_00015 [Ignavibacteriales bacterium]|nr:hypothetical protein [Ignavibacteriales bacterium]